MFLYFNGDSFIAGSELGDHILPDYPGLIEYDSPETIVKQNRDWYIKQLKTTKYDPYYQPLLKKLEEEKSFSGKVAAALKFPFINRGKNGASMDYIARTTIADLIKLKKERNDNIVAFLGTTATCRFELPVNTEVLQHDSTWFNIILPNDNSYRPEEVQNVINYLLQHASDYHLNFNFYKNVLLIKEFCRNNGILLYWIKPKNDFWTNKSNHAQVENTDENDQIYKDYCNLKYIVNMESICQENFKNQKILCPNGHYGEPVHDLVAERLIEIIKSI